MKISIILQYYCRVFAVYNVPKFLVSVSLKMQPLSYTLVLVHHCEDSSLPPVFLPLKMLLSVFFLLYTTCSPQIFPSVHQLIPTYLFFGRCNEGVKLLGIKVDVMVVSVHTPIQNVQMFRRSIYNTICIEHFHFPIRLYKQSPLGTPFMDSLHGFVGCTAASVYLGSRKGQV